MALTRKFLAALGIEADKIDEIITNHVETTDALKAERDEYKAYKEDAEKLPAIQKELDELKAGAYKEKYEKEHADFENFKASIAEKETKAKKVSAFKNILKEIGVPEKRLDTIVKVSAIDDIDFNKDDTVKNLDTLKASLKKEWADFIEKKSTQGARVETPPEGADDDKGGQPSLAAQIAKRHYEQVYGKKEKE